MIEQNYFYKLIENINPEIRLFVDDIRIPETYGLNGWTLAKTSKDAIEILKSENVVEVSLDHDLGDEDTGYRVILWMEENGIWPRDGIYCHSANPVGRQRIQTVIDKMESEHSIEESTKGALAGALLGLSTAFGTPAQADTTPPMKPARIEAEAQSLKTKENVNILARTIYREALNEGPTGMKAVASVIYNRGSGMTDKMVEEVKRRKQFSCWNKMSPTDWANFKIKEYSGKEWETAKNIAESMVNGSFKPIISANHYYNSKLAKPSWAFDKSGKHRPFASLGNHRFMKIG